MLKSMCLMAAVVLLSCSTTPALAAGSADRVYVIECGSGRAEDQSLWSPGVNVGKPIDFANNCYLIRHGNDYMLWETGLSDALADEPRGERHTQPGGTKFVWRKTTRLIKQLADVGVAPGDIRYVAISHAHPDHDDNVKLFTKSILLLQKLEYDFAFMPGKAPHFPADMPMIKLAGEYDIFGDGSAILFPTPGHTPGHQSLRVHLKKTGWVVFSGDSVHFQSNWDNKRVPRTNFNAEQTLQSLRTIEDVMKEHNAQFWIMHDKPQSDGQKHLPQYYE